MKGREHHLLQETYEQGCKVWHGADMVEEMKQAMGITPYLFEAYKVHHIMMHHYVFIPPVGTFELDNCCSKRTIICKVSFCCLCVCILCTLSYVCVRVYVCVYATESCKHLIAELE